MSSRKQQTKNLQRAKTERKPGKSKKRRRARSSSGSPVWLWGVGLAFVVIVVGWNLWQSGIFAGPIEPSRAEQPVDLLPLSEAKRPLTGGHDMARIPRETPAPQSRPAGALLPRVEIPSISFDFGQVPRRPNVAHIFAVQNTGTADLVISNLVTSCGCTTATLSSSTIPSGQRADLRVVFDPDYHVTTGEVVRLVWFATNDPEQPWVELKITAEVQS